MRGRDILRCLAVASLVLGGLALPAVADGLGRFEKALKDAPPGALTYKSGKALGGNGFVLEDLVLTPPPDATQGTKAEPIAIKRVTVEDFDFASTEKNEPPNFIKLRAEGIAISAKPVEGIDLKEMAGIDKITADFQLDYRLDPARKTLTLNRLELDLSGLARIELSFVVDGVTPEQLAQPDAAMNDATLRTATLAFEDRALLGKVLPAAAKMQSTDAEALVKLGKTMLDGMRAGLGPETLAVIDAVGSYMEDYKQPKGPLKISLNPPSKASAAALADIKDPEEAIKALGLVVSYAGTRPGPAASPKAAAPASAPATGSAGATSGCAPGARFFVLHEDAYWSVTVREATKSGEKCVARIDGGDDDILFSLDNTLAWSIDGPGKPAAECKNGAKVLVADKDGGWYAAKVTGNAAATAKCPVKFDSDGDEDKVELKKVRRLD